MVYGSLSVSPTSLPSLFTCLGATTACLGGGARRPSFFSLSPFAVLCARAYANRQKTARKKIAAAGNTGVVALCLEAFPMSFFVCLVRVCTERRTFVQAPSPRATKGGMGNLVERRPRARPKYRRAATRPSRVGLPFLWPAKEKKGRHQTAIVYPPDSQKGRNEVIKSQNGCLKVSAFRCFVSLKSVDVWGAGHV